MFPPVRGLQLALASKCAAALGAATPAGADNTAWSSAFQPLPKLVESAYNPLAPAKIRLGKGLHTDTRLSLVHYLSCNSSHKLDNFGVDNAPSSCSAELFVSTGLLRATTVSVSAA